MALKKYKLCSGEEYELVTKFIGWRPKDLVDWNGWLFKKPPPKGGETLVLVGPGHDKEVVLLMHAYLDRDAFMLDFHSEEIAQHCHRFHVVSFADDADDRFIIPLC